MNLIIKEKKVKNHPHKKHLTLSKDEFLLKHNLYHKISIISSLNKNIFKKLKLQKLQIQKKYNRK